MVPLTGCLARWKPCGPDSASGAQQVQCSRSRGRRRPIYEKIQFWQETKGASWDAYDKQFQSYTMLKNKERPEQKQQQSVLPHAANLPRMVWSVTQMGDSLNLACWHQKYIAVCFVCYKSNKHAKEVVIYEIIWLFMVPLLFSVGVSTVEPNMFLLF